MCPSRRTDVQSGLLACVERGLAGPEIGIHGAWATREGHEGIRAILSGAFLLFWLALELRRSVGQPVLIALPVMGILTEMSNPVFALLSE